jgi:hypothetical protein
LAVCPVVPFSAPTVCKQPNIRVWVGRAFSFQNISSFIKGLPNSTSVFIISPMQASTERLRNFLQYIAVKLIDEPAQAQLKVAELAPNKLRFKLVLASADVAVLIGRNGFTASAIRNVLKILAEKEGVQVNLMIHSHEEEAEMTAHDEGH